MSDVRASLVGFSGWDLFFPDKVSISHDTFEKDETAKYKVLSLVEPDNIVLCFDMPYIVDSVLHEDSFVDFVSNNFDLVLTFKNRLLKKIPNSLRLMTTGTFLDLETLNLNKKENSISFFMSNKSFTSGHQLRHRVFNHMQGKNMINEFSYQQLMTPPAVSKNIMYDKYKYSIIIENEKSDFYLTEKIIDCFLAKTIPIYWGCPSVGDFFNIDGVIEFNSIEELDEIINNLEISHYGSIRYAIEENYTRAQNFPTYDVALTKVINKYFYKD